MENEAYYTSLAQVLPVIALAGAIEVRWLWRFTLLSHDRFLATHGFIPWQARVLEWYNRLLALVVFVAGSLSIFVLDALRTGDGLGWFKPMTLFVVMFAVLAAFLPVSLFAAMPLGII